ncbi:mechanosensitive ion channel family protein [Thalassotalea ponticola]|uniref:mechanosensitive ion channel family protein n=1 Tax=Thalassotalea ponticola TaxID=1523392 RepID=UPI0025B602B3|nr:mechanosensitive ion channel family protein [Thalassotalea ponticola]MDN3652300.1 mechanosensitive ion channel family protein [Thalassotalea ponticola]
MDNLMQLLQHYLSFSGDNVFLQATIIIALSLIVAWVIDRIVISWVKRIAERTEGTLDDQLVELLHQPLFYSVVVFGISIASRIVQLPDNIGNVIFPIFYTLLLVLWTLFFIRITRISLRRMAANDKHFKVLHMQTLPLFENLALIVILILSIYFILSSWSIDMSAWLASAGIVGIAVGFAAKDTLANLFSGVFIMADAPYKIKDYIVLETGERGEVTNIGLRSTRILTRDHIEITVPNSMMGNTKIINESAGPSTKSRIRAQVGCAYDSDIDLVQEVLMQVAQEEKELCRFPQPVVRFRAFGGSSLDFELMGWIDLPENRGRILHQINNAIFKKFAEHNIEIPYAKRDLYIKELPSNVDLSTLTVDADKSAVSGQRGGTMS